MDENLQQHTPSHMIVAAGVATDGDRFFVARRGPQLKESGRWEFPGGKVGPGETIKSALQREIKEELGVNARVGEPLGVGTFPGGTVVAFRIEFDKRPERSTDHDELRWVPAAEVLDLPLAVADYSIAVSALNHRVEINRLGAGSLVRLVMGFYFLAGFIIAGALYLFQSLLAGFVPTTPWGTPIVGIGSIGMMAIFMLPIFYALLGGFFALLLAGLYNFLSRLLGGIAIEIRKP